LHIILFDLEQGRTQEAIEIYTSALNICPDHAGRPSIVLKSTLLSNRSMCHLKLYDKDSSDKTALNCTINDCTVALSLLQPYLSDAQPLQSKLLYRRAKARISLVSKSSPNDANSEVAQWLVAAEKDLRLLLSVDPTKNNDASTLSLVRTLKNKKQEVSGMTSSSHPIAQALMYLDTMDDLGKTIEALRFIHASLIDDLLTTTDEIIGRNGFQRLLSIAKEGLNVEGVKEEEDETCQILALRSLSMACAHPPFAKLLQQKQINQFQASITHIIRARTSEELIMSCMRLQLCYIINCHLSQHDVEVAERHVDGSNTIQQCILGFQSPFTNIQSMGLNLLSAWMEPNPQNLLEDCNIPTAKKETTEEEVRRMTPKQLSAFRKLRYERNKGQTERSRRNALLFFKSRGMKTLISITAATEDGQYRRNCIVCLARIVNCVKEEDGKLEKIKALVAPLLGWNSLNSDDGLVIEEIHDEDEEKEGDGKLKICMERGLLATSLLLADGELGTWALQHGWSNGKSMDDWQELASSNTNQSKSIASEVASAAAGVEKSRPWILACIDSSPIWKDLLICEDKEVRSGAASAMAKLGLANKAVSSDDGELFGLLESASSLLDGEESTDMKSENDVISLSSSPALVERGVELLSYLSSKTMIKEELAHGYAGVSNSKSILEKLVDLSEKRVKKSTSVSYALSTIFASLSVSIETLRKEAFEGKDVTAEEYDQLQAMSKTEGEKENEESQKERDSPEATSERIRNMASKNVPRALVNLMEGATDTTLEQIVTCMTRISGENTVRGMMVQQGCLSACIQMTKGKNPSEAEEKALRQAQHCVGKLLVTTNPGLLTTSQRMGSIQPLMQLIKDTKSTDLQQFEALLSVTNLASYDDETKNKIIAERGIAVLSYAMFSSHEMVRRAATEAMSNLVPHPDVMNYFREPDQLKIWVAFAGEFEDNFECARAAVGCLAMVSQDSAIALELSKMKNAKEMIASLLKCGNLEIMHRILALILNLTNHGGNCQEFITSTGSLVFLESYVGSYHDGEKVKDLKFDPGEQGQMNVTLDIAKEIIRKYNP